jgi:hypothetical protein
VWTSWTRAVALILWISAALFAVPAAIATSGAPLWVGDTLAGGLFVLPICWLVARNGSSDASRHATRSPMIAFGAVAIAGLLATVVLAADDLAPGAIAAFYSSCFCMSVAVANSRSWHPKATAAR